MRSLGQPNAAFAGDHGEADPALRALLTDAADDAELDTYLRAVAALCTSRLLLPIIATGDDSADRDPNGSREAEMAAMLLRSDQGRTAVLAFTGIDLLAEWSPAARPVPCTLDEVAATAVETESVAVVIDLPADHGFVIDGEVLAQLAEGRRLVELPDGEFGWLQVVGD